MRQTMVRVACSLAISWGLNAQAPAKFEVASVKVSEAPPGPIRGFGRANGGPDTTTPGQFTATGMSLKMLLFNYAFNFMDYQYSAPSWMEKEVYDVTAKVPPGVTRDQFRVMLRNLLIERFKIEVHHEQREMTTYDLVVAKSGLKMKPSKFDDNTPRDPGPGPGGSIHLEKDADGFPAIPESSGPMTFGTGMNGQLVWLTNKASIQQLIDVLERNVKVPISDQTGLKGNFACMLHFLNGAPADESNPTIFRLLSPQA